VATLGSYDEEVAAEMVGARTIRKEPLFKTQVEWIEALVEFMHQHPNIFLIIRVHPREFPNRRDSKKSEHARLLEQALLQLPANVKVNWPTDQISIYDLVEETDVFLNSWSSTGKDMALLGIPTVIYSDEIPLYPTELNYFGDTLESYFSAIERALGDGWSAEKVRRSYRWAAYEFSRSTIDIGDSFHEIEMPKRSLLEKVGGRLRRQLDKDYRQRGDLQRFSLPRSADQIVDVVESAARTVVDRLQPEASVSSEEETRALRAEMRRLAEALFPSLPERASSRLFARLTASEVFN
jgi:CDP-glycerol glycerophosphotransferase (TagB/SpsB family)